MTIALRELSNLDAAEVNQNLAEMTQRLQEANSSLELRRGVLHDLLVYYHSLFAARNQAAINDYLNVRSLAVIAQQPALADPEGVDAVLSNFRLQRQPGATATGQVTIIVANNVTVTIAAGAVFQANGKQFVTQRVFTAKAEAAQIIAPGDRLFTRLQDGTYAFTIDVIAVNAGTSSLIAKDVLVVPTVLPPGYVTSYAVSDFTGGRDAEPTAALMARLQQGIAARGAGNRVTSAALLRQTPAFANIVALSIIGFGDPEMLRDQHTIFPVSLGGRTDWYLRSVEQVQRLNIVSTATLIEKSNKEGTWQLALSRDDAPGFYEVASIRLPLAQNVLGSFPIVSETRNVDLSGSGFIPDILIPLEGVYSRFQTAILTFTDTTTDVTNFGIGTTQDYNVEVKALPLVSDLQDFLSAFETRADASDALVKAAIPCFVQLSLNVYKNSGTADPDVAAIKNVLSSAVNQTAFVGTLYASRLQDLAYSVLPGDQRISAIDMLGKLRYPDSTIKYLRSDEVLQIPDDHGHMVSARTVQFFTTPDDIAVSIVVNVPTNI